MIFPLIAAVVAVLIASQAGVKDVAITGVTIIDPSAANPYLRNQTILVQDGVIKSAGPARAITIPKGARIIDARGKFAIPGLWDMHVHFMNTGVSALPLLVANGITSVREMGGYLDSTRAWQGRMAAGTLVGPRIVTPGPILESAQYLQGVRERSARLGGRLAPRVLPYRVEIATPEDARRVMDSLARLKVDFVKIRTTGSAEAYFAILREARRVGLTVVGHQPSVVTLASASDSGQRSIEHAFLPPLSGLGDSARFALYERFAHNGTWYTPTLVVTKAVLVSGDSAAKAIFGDSAAVHDERRQYASPWLLGWWRMQVDERETDTSTARLAAMRAFFRSSAEDVRRMHAAGVNILAGTDAGSVLVYPGFSLHEELELMVSEAGLTPKDALYSATVAPARFLGLTAKLGAIAAGKVADIVLLNADPLIDIHNARRIFAVVQAGHVFNRSELDALLRGVRDSASRFP